LMNYFSRDVPPDQYVTFSRFSPSLVVNWEESTKTFGSLKVHPTESISNLAHCVHTDFANMFLGGGVLEMGCVQEEIMFSVTPECLTGMLFCSRMRDDEAILIRGAERYSDYTGYAQTFEYVGNHDDPAPLDKTGHKDIDIICIDAVHYREPYKQFEPKYIKREANKAFVGFSSLPSTSNKPIATGNWGCGVFRGNHQLKALIQLMAAAEAGRPLEYCAFKTESVMQPLVNIHQYLVSQNITVGQVMRALLLLEPTDKVFDGVFKILNPPTEEASFFSSWFS